VRGKFPRAAIECPAASILFFSLLRFFVVKLLEKCISTTKQRLLSSFDQAQDERDASGHATYL
jgi:hypothetical protein